MHIIEFFYSRKDIRSMRTLQMLNDISGKVPNLVVLGYDMESEVGLSHAIKKKINYVPSLIIDKKSVIEGVPYSQKQILSKFK